MNVNFQNGDDSEKVEELAALQMLPCPLSNITDIGCRIASTQEPADCLECKEDEKCEDQEVRVYCQCHEEGENTFPLYVPIYNGKLAKKIVFKNVSFY